MGEVTAVAQALPPWVLVVIAAAVGVKYLGQALAEGSEQWARILGPLGRRWRSRAERRTEKEAADLVALQRQVENLSVEVERLTARDKKRGEFEEKLREYLVYDANWHFRAQLAAAGAGTTLPDHMSFAQWEASRP
ncbi:hypothetical protein [Nocardia sp. NBC_01009]|uniref:hypothetical protein n=1 Tax=Nocardia sp. NBC_01009 TaxID=2975996 RepID=UPI00386CBF54|nr:hypothetical protein OHA42_04890 [Nocardia sp. NBC_01009]